MDLISDGGGWGWGWSWEEEDDEEEEGKGGREGCGVVLWWGGRLPDMSAWAAAREVGDGARSMSGLGGEVSGLGV